MTTAKPTWAKRGAQCICAAADNGRWKCREGARIEGPRRGAVLTILARFDDDVDAHLEFAEWPGCMFRARWFRPAQKAIAATDVAMFKRLASKTGVASMVEAGR